MEKGFREEDLKELEAEIDSAVDRLFVSKKGTVTEPLPTESSRLEPSTKSAEGSTGNSLSSLDSVDSSILELSSEIEKSLGETEESVPQPEERPKLEPESVPSLISAPQKLPEPPSPPKSLEKLESQLLSLEWEITKENLDKTQSEIVLLQKAFQEESDVLSVLELMKKVLRRMITQGEKISPPLMKFLMDSKETIKLFLKKETHEEIEIYRRLAYEGIQARFSCLETPLASPEPLVPPRPVEKLDLVQVASAGPKMVEELSNTLSDYFGRVDERFKKIDQHLSGLNEWIRNASEELLQRQSSSTPSVQVTVFKVDGHYFGVPSEKVFKLFKVPASFHDRFANQQKIRLKDFEMKIVDLKTLLSLPEGKSEGERRILIVRDDGGYKGFLIDNVLDRVSTHPAAPGRHEAYASGVIQWTYQRQPMEIPLLNVARL
jgi:chemotaxis signal transduction protein